MDDYNEIMTNRLSKAERMRTQGHSPYRNDFRATHTLAAFVEATHADATDMGELADDAPTYMVAGRVMAINKMGKAAFLRIRDTTSTVDSPHVQLYIRKDRVEEATYAHFQENLDVGDIVGVVGFVFRTRRGELSVMVHGFQIVTKSIRPLPEKWHGLTDVETRFRQRYTDLIMNLEAREVFQKRSRIIQFIRTFLDERQYMEVETPMLQTLAGGATARPFETHHNALNIPLFMRIAPELYLKRLVVGGFERVYEINRNFRNEGMSPKHNPEFTMLEFYQAYATFEDLIALSEEMLSELCMHLHGSHDIAYGDHAISMAKPYARFTVRESLAALAEIPEDQTDTLENIRAVADQRSVHVDAKANYGQALMALFDALVEHQLIQPTFITGYPTDVSPLSRKNEANPQFVDRFEFFVAGNELANGFSELNDPVDQRERFEAQMAQREAGDDEAHPIDHDYIRALEYGMPPAAGEGIGIDRLVMLLTNQQSIREVIFFPHMRPEGG